MAIAQVPLLAPGEEIKFAAHPLISAIRLAEAATSHFRGSVPILSHVRLVSGQGRLTAYGTDLDTCVMAATDYDGPPFDVAVPGKLLLDAVGFCVGEYQFSAADHQLTIGEDPAFSLPTLPVDDFPMPSAFEPRAAFDLPAAQLLADLKAVAPAMSTEERRFYLNGICFHGTDGNLAMAATDGHRLHRISRPMTAGAFGIGRPIVHRDAIGLLRRAIEAEERTEAPVVRCEFGDSRASFIVGNVTITTKLIDGTFPAYQLVIPDYPEGHGKLTAAASDLGRIAAAAQIVSEKKRVGLLVLDFAKGEAAIESSDGGTASAHIPGTIEGEPPKQIGVTPGYLADVLTACGDGEVVVVHFGGPVDPIRFDAQDGAFVGVVMPMRV